MSVCSAVSLANFFFSKTSTHPSSSPPLSNSFPLVRYLLPPFVLCLCSNPYFLLPLLKSICFQSHRQLTIFQQPIRAKIIDTSEASCTLRPLIAISVSASAVPLVLPLALTHFGVHRHKRILYDLAHTLSFACHQS